MSCPETVPVCPERSWKLLEGHGRFRKVLGSTTHSPAPLSLGGKPPRLPWPTKEVGAHQGEGIPSRWKVQLSNMAGFRWEGLGGWGVQVGLPTPLIAPQGSPGPLYNEGRGWGRKTTCPQGLCATLPPLNPVAPQLDPGLDAVLDRNPLGFYPSSFLGGVHLWTVERCWITATGCVDTNGGVVPSTLLRGACSWDLSVGLDRGTVRGVNILAVGRSLKFLAAGICTDGLHQLYFRYIGW